ncbi:MAG TPA: Gfo/Idh/MocA family oxidoreductase [Phycisphaerae bacterium]|nr:Gfo/Idh/MocA family oxidoreductase [Phycisphaerae bacterium]
MALQCVVLGMELIQQDWIDAIKQAQNAGVINVVAVGQRNISAARELGEVFEAPFYSDLRRMMLETTPQILIMDRPREMPLDFIEACVHQGIGIFSLGPPVQSLSDAHKLNMLIEPRTHMLYIWPRMSRSWAFLQASQTESYLHGPHFISGLWAGLNHAMAKSWDIREGSIGSLPVLAWDAFRTIVELAGIPALMYASIDGTGGEEDRFIHAGGTAAVVMRFAGTGTASLTITDKDLPFRRELLLFNREGRLKLAENSYNFLSSDGKIQEQDIQTSAPAWKNALTELEEFCRQFTASTSPHRGWPHLLTQTAAMMTAMIVSHRTGTAESPQHFLGLTR